MRVSDIHILDGDGHGDPSVAARLFPAMLLGEPFGGEAAISPRGAGVLEQSMTSAHALDPTPVRGLPIPNLVAQAHLREQGDGPGETDHDLALEEALAACCARHTDVALT